MLTVEEKVDRIEERVDKLEVIFGHFMAQTGAAVVRLERTVERLERTVERIEAAIEQDRKEWNKRWGELANKLGTVVEDIIAPGIPRIAQEYFGCPEIEDFMVRRKVINKKDRSKRREFDVIAVCQEVVILNETKEYVKIGYIDQFVQFLQSGEFYDYFPEYQGKTLIPVFSSLYLADDIVNYLTKHGIYALAMSEEAVALLNFQQVKASITSPEGYEESE
jgi:hypothetical protein